MGPILVTGGAGFFGGLLKRRLLSDGHEVVSLDLQPDEDVHPRLTSLQGDIRNQDLLGDLFEKHRFASIFHCAAVLAHAVKDHDLLWTSNVDGTRALAQNARRFGTRSLVFTSSNCLWAQDLGRPVVEGDEPSPAEIYGRSKLAGETILQTFGDDLNVSVIRCPTIVDEGRLGLLAILFEFISEGRTVWVVGNGVNRYQFIYAQDLVEACLLASARDGSGTYNIGSDDVKPLRDVFAYVADKAATGARVRSLPVGPTLLAMKLAYKLGLSPLGPYQYKMIASNFVFDTSHIKRSLGWAPTLTNEEMLWRAYRYFNSRRSEIATRKDVSAHRQAAKMGVIRLLKWVS
jgi:UDP-glucose 4-epimerase